MSTSASALSSLSTSTLAVSGIATTSSNVASYAATSPYYNTPIVGSLQYLSTWVSRTVPASPTDTLLVINETYNLRPDLLAADLYGDAALWWVFAVRNPNTLQDPLGNFVSGLAIYLPDPTALKSALGY
jgi:hypothetical protein